MFENALIRKHSIGPQVVDVGRVAETLLFYDNVHIVAQRGLLSGLIKSLGIDTLVELIDRKILTLSYEQTDLGTVTNSKSGIGVHQFLAFSLTGNKSKKKLSKFDDVEELVFRALGRTRDTKKGAAKLFGKISVGRSNENHSFNDIVANATSDIQDLDYVRSIIEFMIRTYAKGFSFPKNWNLDVLSLDDGFVVSTDLNFEQINSEYHKDIPASYSSLDIPYLMNQVLEARAEMQMAADYMAEIVTTDVGSTAIRTKMSSLIRKRDSNASQIEQFKDVHLEEGRAIAEVINSGERTFAEFVQVLEKAKRFKSWLKNVSPDGNLLKAYHEAATAETWVDKLPSKGFRFVMMSALGLAADAAFSAGVGSVTALSLSAADSLLIDKVIKGWRPNHFVEGSLKKFLSES